MWSGAAWRQAVRQAPAQPCRRRPSSSAEETRPRRPECPTPTPQPSRRTRSGWMRRPARRVRPQGRRPGAWRRSRPRVRRSATGLARRAAAAAVRAARRRRVRRRSRRRTHGRTGPASPRGAGAGKLRRTGRRRRACARVFEERSRACCAGGFDAAPRNRRATGSGAARLLAAEGKSDPAGSGESRSRRGAAPAGTAVRAPFAGRPGRRPRWPAPCGSSDVSPPASNSDPLPIKGSRRPRGDARPADPAGRRAGRTGFGRTATAAEAFACRR